MIQKQKIVIFENSVKELDYKDIETLKNFINPHARLLSRKKTGLSARHQRMVARAIKRARFMGFMPYVAR